MTDDWRDRIILTPTIRIPGERAALYRAAARGSYVRVIRSAYVETSNWAALDFEGRHRTRMRAASLLDPRLVFSHLSAAVLWGLPVVGGDLSIPHALGDPVGGSRSRTSLRRHAVSSDGAVALVDDLPVTSYAQTLVHVAAGFEPEVAVPVLDAALRRDDVDVDDLSSRLRTVPSSGGRARGLWSLGFASPHAESPGESLSRVAIHRLRLPAPELQVRITDRDGLAGVVDFFWPDHRLAGEFDGIGKYLREAFTGDREPGEVVVAEKRREDRIRATSLGMARWGWDAARNPPALRRILSDAGLRAP